MSVFFRFFFFFFLNPRVKILSLPTMADQQSQVGRMHPDQRSNSTSMPRGPLAPVPKKSTLAQQLDRQHRAEVELLRLAQAVRAERQGRLLASLIDSRRRTPPFPPCRVVASVLCSALCVRQLPLSKQTKKKNKNQPNQPNQTKPNQTKPNQPTPTPGQLEGLRARQTQLNADNVAVATAITAAEAQGYGAATQSLTIAARARHAAPALHALHTACGVQLTHDHGAATAQEAAQLAALAHTLAKHEAALADMVGDLRAVLAYRNTGQHAARSTLANLRMQCSALPVSHAQEMALEHAQGLAAVAAVATERRLALDARAALTCDVGSVAVVAGVVFCFFANTGFWWLLCLCGE